MRRSKWLGAGWILCSIAMVLFSRNVLAQTTTYFSQTQFENATNPSVVSIPPPTYFADLCAGIPLTGCGISVTIPFAGNNSVNISDPATGAMAIFGPGAPVPLTNTNPNPVANTLIGDGEDDYLLVFQVPVRAVGLRLLTNSCAQETVVLRDVNDNILYNASIDAQTSTNTF